MVSIYAVGIGPGDPELLTLKAVRLLREADILCVPRGREEGESLALDIVRGSGVDLTGKVLLEAHFPMKRGSQREALRPTANRMLQEAMRGKRIVFITLGDPTLYSTWFHLYDALLEEAGANSLPMPEVRIVPGVSSINAAAAASGLSLALSGQRVAIIPAIYLEEGSDKIELTLAEYETVVFMKAHSVLGKLKELLDRKGLLCHAHFVAGVGMKDQIIKPLSEVTEGEGNYFSTVIVRRPDA